uniref:Phosphoglycolate phosphatase n=1 Tax=uncultured marine thaumarchaeote SAT1000_43_E07 TaxID=1456410 RepID=A0A075I8Q9_9ARCH|nr:SPP-like hydrolase [uncultured marine thaumarchaeote SAT1000_43_E07]
MIQRDLLNKKTFAVDIDGTITMNGMGTIHLQALSKLRSLRDDGHNVILVTGRSSVEGYLLAIFGGLTHLAVGENGGCITFGDKIQHRMLGNKGECIHALATIQSKLDIEIKEKPVFPRMTEVVLERTFDIDNVRKIIDENNLNVILTDSGYAYHINSKGVDKGSGFMEAIKMLEIDVNDTIAIGDSDTDVPLFKVVKNNIAVANSTENLKKLAKIVTTKKSGEGVLEGLDIMLSEI